MKMRQIYKIALTGGPCAGKTEALAYLKANLEKKGTAVFCLEEVATELMNENLTPETMGNYAFHRLLFRKQLYGEERLTGLAENVFAEKCVILCDRGLMDSKAYVNEADFALYTQENGWNENKILCAYEAVFHLVTAADGAEVYYQSRNNLVRSEDIEAARRIDNRLKAVWIGTPHLRIIDNSTDFDGKLRRLLSETLAVVGIPAPLEIERKFLIIRPHSDLLQHMELCRCVPISQTYMETPDEGRFRIRKRGQGKDAVYVKTVKKKISEICRIEVEERITESEYECYISQKEYCSGTIVKERYCIVWRNTYYELDLFPFWNKFALLEIELLDEAQPYLLPDFVTVLREVTFEKEFRNKSLSIAYKEFFTSNHAKKF